MLNKMGRKQKLIVIFCFVLISGLYIVKNNDPKEKPTFRKTILTQKEQVFDESQFIFKPILEELGDKKQLKILLEITSYMNPEILELNYQNQTMLELDESFSLPSEWHIIEKGKHKIIGQLIFKLNQQNIKNFALKIFTYSDHEINWD